MIRKTEGAYRLVLRFFFIVGLLLCLPAITTAIEPSASFTDKEAEAFIAEWVKLSENNKNFDAVMAMYAGEVEFYKLGTVKKSTVAEDKRKYFDRWPQREHSVISIILRPGSHDNEKQAEVVFHYKIRRGQKSLEGDAKTLVSLRKSQGRAVIFSEKDLPTVASEPSGSASGTEYIVWSGYGGTVWIDGQGTVLRQSKEKVPVSVVNGGLYTVRIEKRSVKQADCDSVDYRDPDAKLKMVPATDREFFLIRIDQDGKEHKTILIKAADDEDGSSSTELEVLGLVGLWLFVDRRVFSDVCGAPHGVVPHELLVVNMKTASTITAYRGQKKSEVEKSVLGEGTLSGEADLSPVTLFTDKEYRALMNALRKRAFKDLQDFMSGDEEKITLTRVKPIVSNNALGLEVLLTAPTGYASSDGEWSSYTRSHAYPAPFVPELLKPYQAVPVAVLKWWKANKAESYPSWSEVPSSGPARQQMEKLFQ
ncbi:MAG: hypothetical protein A2Z46_00620 [Nitrospirae bacterium RBG_19FT_COMBO_55_12]|nr:MAG: hypothetical protein A2Z46_00620 [Nitrospirae bacterium RBG_19FT_COMBO_55_12]